MNSFARLAALAALVSSTFALTVDTPSQSGLVACQPFLITWHDGTGPYYPTVVAPGPGQLYKQFDQTDATSLTWKVDLPAGTVVNLGIKDSSGTQQYSATVTIVAGSDTSCLNGASGSNSASTGAPSTGAPTGASSTGPAGSSTKSTAPSSSGSKSSSAASSSATGSGNNGAMAAGASTFGVAAVMGLVGAALF